MSLILDALNRSRQDTDQVPGLATQHYMESDFEERGNARQYLMLLALLLAFLAIGWLLFDRYSKPAVPAPVTSTDVSGQAQHPPRQPVAAKPAPAAIIKKQRVEPAVTASEPSINPTPAARPGAAVTKQLEIEKATDPSPQVKKGNVTAVADLYRQRQSAPTPTAELVEETASKPVEKPSGQQPASEPVAAEEPPASREEQPIDIEKTVLKARDELKDSRLQEHPAPFIASLSQQTKNAIPTIYYQQHDYSNKKSRSSVVLNGKKVGAGGSPAAGLKVDEILPDSVVLSYRGTQFRLRALNSWINL